MGQELTELGRCEEGKKLNVTELQHKLQFRISQRGRISVTLTAMAESSGKPLIYFSYFLLLFMLLLVKKVNFQKALGFHE